jgi:hypothetical protein
LETSAERDPYKPRVRTGGVKVHCWPIPSGVVETPGHDPDHRGCGCRPREEPRTTIGTKAAAYQLSAIAFYLEIFDLTANLERISGHDQN